MRNILIVLNSQTNQASLAIFLGAVCYQTFFILFLLQVVKSIGSASIDGEYNNMPRTFRSLRMTSPEFL